MISWTPRAARCARIGRGEQRAAWSPARIPGRRWSRRAATDQHRQQRAGIAGREEADLLHQHVGLQQVGDRSGLGDHVGVDRPRPVEDAGGGGRAQHRQLAQRLVRIVGQRRSERPQRRQLRLQQPATLASARPAVVVAGAGNLQQLGDDPLVHVGVLAQVERRQVEAEAVDCADQVGEPAVREERAVVGDQRRLDGLQVGLQRFGRVVRRRPAIGETRAAAPAPVSAAAAAASRA